MLKSLNNKILKNKATEGLVQQAVWHNAGCTPAESFVGLWGVRARTNICVAPHYSKPPAVTGNVGERKIKAEIFLSKKLHFRTTFSIFVKWKKIENTDGLYEIRVQNGSNIFRIFCFFDQGKLVVLANGFQKKTQKTPINEIELAIKIKLEYESEMRSIHEYK